LEGVITLEDLLEEIVGDISDEHDEEVNEQITPVNNREYLLAGGLAVRDLNRRLKLNLPESEAYTTIAGFLMTQAGHVLNPGEVVKYNGLSFEIDRVEKRRVIGVHLDLPEASTETETPETAEGARAAG
jgi:CBS domain containing-hemolysin-like protein